MDTADAADTLQIPLILRRAICRIGPDIGRGVLRIDQPLAQPRPVMRRGIGGFAAPDHAMSTVDRDMRLVAIGRDCDVDLRLALRPGLGFAELHRPARIGVLLARAGRLVGPDLGGFFAVLYPGLLVIVVALPRCGHQRRIDDLAGHGQIARAGDRIVEPGEQALHGAGGDQRLAEVPQRIGVRHRIAGAQATEAHPAQPVGHQVFRLRQRQAVQRLQDEHAELQHRIEGRAAALAQVPRTEGCRQFRAEQFEIHRRRELLQRVALGGEFTQALLHVPKAGLA